jgi:alpha-ketoglutarate-dependent taurine dioxygenase
MSLEFEPLPAPFGVRLDGIDLRVDHPASVRAAVRDAWLEHSLVLVRGQDLDVAEHQRFVEWFGPLSMVGYAPTTESSARYISNTRVEGVAREGSLLKHQDFCFYDTLLPGLSLYAEEVPEVGGATIFASTKLAYERLPDDLKRRIGSFHARHVYDRSNDYGTQRFRIASAPGAPTATHPVVLPHPYTGQPLLFVNELMTDSIVELDGSDSEALLEELWSYLDDDAVRYEHEWQVNDLIVWDNLSLQHGRRDFPLGQRRSLRRFQIGA